jgi:primosomal protein N' (replication factor Y)
VPSSPNATDRVIAVAVPVPGLGLLRYRAPGSERLVKGARVVVPLGGRTVTGCIVDPDTTPPESGALKDVSAVLDEWPFLPASVVDLALWVGEYYASGPGDAIAGAMPPSARRGEADSFRTVNVAELTPETRSGLFSESASKMQENRSQVVDDAGDKRVPTSFRGVKQRQAIEILRAEAGGVALPELARRGVSGETVKTLVKAGLVHVRQDVVMRDPFAGHDEGVGRWTMGSDGTEPALTAEQVAAFRHLEEAATAGVFKTLLLHGVTGSGKTELYLRLAKLVLTRGRRVLVLVPEIALTPSLAGLFRSRFGDRVAIQHSGLSAGERHDQWQRIRHGEVDVVVGTRSAVFAPMEGLGLIVVDEEHDASYKQDEVPRYHGRDLAVLRGRMEQALVVLGSATPSLETAANARAGRYDTIRLTERVLNRPLAAVRVIDMRREYAAHGADVTLSAPLVEAMDDRLAKGEQTLVLLNRRGFATVIFCRDCGASVECPHCSVTLTFHKAARRLRCHYCNYATPVPQRCGACGGQYLEQSGFGTERLESDIRARFPGARVARVDRDTIRRKGAIARLLRDVARGRLDILVGTQMIAKGHDFPAVTLVGVVSADVGLGLADFRAAERTFQLLTQVVGRAGRGETPGEAFIQTLYPDHYSIQAAAAQAYEPFFEREIEFRRHMHYPPETALINAIVKGRSLDAAMTDAQDLVRRTRVHGPDGKVIGPAPAALSKIKDEYRAQFFIKGRQRKPMRLALARALDERPDLKRKTSIDVDPVNLI